MKDVKNIQFLTLKTPDKVFGIEKSLLKLFLMPLGVLFIFLVSLGLVVIPKIEEIKNNIKSIDNFNTQIKLTNAKKNYLTSIDIEQLNKEADLLNKAVLKEKKSYLLVGVVRKIADNFGFQIKSFLVNPGEVKETGSKNLKISDKEIAIRMPINIILIGPSERNLDLIKALENSLPILFIDKFESKSLGGASELEMTISSYYVPSKGDYINGNLTIKDLQLTDKESELLSIISQFGIVDGAIGQEIGTTQFVEYSRTNPFSL